MSFWTYPNDYALYAGTIQLSGLNSAGALTAPIVTNSNQLCANLYCERALYSDSSGNIASLPFSILNAPTLNYVLTGITANTASWQVPAAFSGNIPNADVITANIVNSRDINATGNINASGWINSASNISASGAITGASVSVSGTLTSTVLTGTAPLVVSSTTQVANLNAASAGLASTSNALESATTTVNVSAAAQPQAGEVLTATSATTAVWASPTSPTGNISMNVITANSVLSDNVTINNSLNGTGNINVSGWINTSANISSQSLATGSVSASNGTFSGNVNVTGWINSGANISAVNAITSASVSVTGQLTSTVSTGTAPLVVSSTTQVANLNAASAGLASTSNALESATTTVNVSSSVAPTAGYALIADSSTAASWQALPTSGSSGSQFNFTNTQKTGGTTTMTTSSTYFQRFFDAANQSVNLPTLDTEGRTYVFLNETSGTLTIKSSGGSTVTTLTAANQRCMVLGWNLSAPTSASAWTVVFSFP